MKIWQPSIVRPGIAQLVLMGAAYAALWDFEGCLYSASVFRDCLQTCDCLCDKQVGPGDDEYGIWSEMVAGFHAHLLQKGISPMYEEHWNEPDLTEYVS